MAGLMQLQRVENQQQLRLLWADIADELRKLKARTGELWLVEDVWAALLAQRALLQLIQLDSARVGFIITELQWDTFAVAPVLNVWIAVGRHLFKDYGQFLYSEMVALARASGATKVRMTSPRRGWERSGIDQFMAPVRTIWEGEVTQ